ncbi:hypothetical protein KAR91_65220 [Candidatus Pacearchaeota archaeon]|nr:hypothetical protein [Candidatus Pacearchaeota archaeon]
MEFDLTEEEEKAIRALKRAEKIWPESLWLYSGNGTLHVMRSGENGEQVHRDGFDGIDPDYCITSVDIQNDGGDW